MADIRINALATTAASTASDDFIAVDGSANGTRKLDAYSPTFGGNLTVSGTVSSGVVTSSFADALSSFTRTGLNGAGAAGVLAIATDGKTINDAISFAIQGKDSANNTQTYGQIKATIVDPTSTSEDSTFTIQTVTAGSLADAAVFSQSAATLTGNLTVSGTGTSSVAGSLGIGTTNPNAKAAINGTADTGPTTNSNGILKVGDQTQTNGLIVGLYNSGTYGVYLQASDIRSGGGTPNYPIIVNPNGGNLLIGTTTDGGQKLQVSGTSNFSNPGSSTIANFTNSANADFQIVLTASTSAKIGPSTPTSLILQTNGTTALTLDSSQNATFAGTSVTVDGASTGSTLTLKRASNANGAIISYKTTTTSKWYHGLRGLVDDNWYLQNDVAGNTALFFDASTSNATFAGSIAIGNTVNTVSPTSPNRTITMVIGGTTYYIHAKTTND